MAQNPYWNVSMAQFWLTNCSSISQQWNVLRLNDKLPLVECSWLLRHGLPDLGLRKDTTVRGLWVRFFTQHNHPYCDISSSKQLKPLMQRVHINFSVSCSECRCGKPEGSFWEHGQGFRWGEQEESRRREGEETSQREQRARAGQTQTRGHSHTHT